MELCDGTRVHKIHATDLTETILCSEDAPSLIGFCLASHQCTFPQPPGITKYWLQNDTGFVINLLQSEYTIESSKTRRWDLIERFLMYIGTSSTIMKIFFNHRKDVTSPLDLLYSFICLYKDEESKKKKITSSRACQSLLSRKEEDGITRDIVLKFLSMSADNDVFHKECVDDLPSNFPNALQKVLSPDSVVIAGGSLAQLKTPWANVLPSSDIDVFILNKPQLVQQVIEILNEKDDYIVCTMGTSVVCMVPKPQRHNLHSNYFKCQRDE